MTSIEVNFDGLVGPTHYYAGLAFGNLASEANAKRASNPKAAALQGLRKMKFLMELGIPQAVFPPHERPAIEFLKKMGFSGKHSEILQNASQQAPVIFNAVCSASSMWMANAATVTPSIDSIDRHVHITPANLVTHFHRAIEAEFNTALFKTIFSDEAIFKIHNPLFSHVDFADEGAANHNRLCHQYGHPGIHLFVYGKDEPWKKKSAPHRNPARQALLAAKAIGRLHQLSQDQLIFAKQNPDAIDHGVFHNDVISVANQNVFLYHELAFENQNSILDALRVKVSEPFYSIGVLSQELSIKEAVQSYLFNSQIVTLKTGKMALISPIECQGNKANDVLLRILHEDNPIESLHFVDCGQSMLNGGGPACLRLRVVLTQSELKACHPNVFLDQTLYEHLVNWVSKHYRDKLTQADFLDPLFLQEIYTALDELTKILKLGVLYNFQKV